MYYRLYFMNTSNGHIDCAEDLQARDDQEAIDTAQPLVASMPIELWCGARKVHRFETASTRLLERYRAHKAAQKLPGSGVDLGAACATAR